MNLLFIMMDDFDDIGFRGTYTDVMREFLKNGHKVYVVSPTLKLKCGVSNIINREGYGILKIGTRYPRMPKSVSKGLILLAFESIVKKQINKYWCNISFDAAIYATPPITVSGVAGYIRKRYDTVCYLLLKDIFPQNAVDLGVIRKNSLIYKYFRLKEKKLYKISDFIGCMSQANVDYLLKNNPEIDVKKIHVNPNSMELFDIEKGDVKVIRKKYGIPYDKVVFVYGGSLGEPQGTDFLMDLIAGVDKEELFFIIVGKGTKFDLIKRRIEDQKLQNTKLFEYLEREEYEILVSACDIGIILLSSRFTIPNFPSRLLPYMHAHKPVLAMTDCNTDIGKVITEGGFGWWCKSDDVKKAIELISKIVATDYMKIGGRAYLFLKKYYTSDMTYNIIVKCIKQARMNTIQ